MLGKIFADNMLVDLNFKNLIDSIPEIIFFKDNNLRYVLINKQCEEFYASRGIYDVLGKTDFEFDPEYASTCVKHDKIVLETKKPLYIEEVFGEEGTDEFRIFHTIKTPLLNNKGELIGLVGSVRDITEQKLIEKKFRELSYRDNLTGLYNRTYFIDKIEEIKNNETFNYGIVIADINGLKKVNDNLGHLDGDIFIKSISNVIESVLGRDGILIRWGGDEFITILNDSSKCEDYIKNVEDAFSNKYYKDYKMSVSQGYEIFTENVDINSVIKKADKKLYKVKYEMKKCEQ